jgi:glycosyltransferase involved in cell wall biosynthesis
LTESLGIGLIEGAQAGLAIVASDRPYVFELVEPSLTFDPLNTRSLEDAMRTAISRPLRPAILRIRSRIEELVSRITTPIP